MGCVCGGDPKNKSLERTTKFIDGSIEEFNKQLEKIDSQIKQIER